MLEIVEATLLLGADRLQFFSERKMNTIKIRVCTWIFFIFYIYFVDILMRFITKLVIPLIHCFGKIGIIHQVNVTCIIQ